METILRDIIEGVSNTYGDQFLRRIVVLLGKAIGSDFTMIARINKKLTEATTIAFEHHQEVLENITYLLEGTPCDTVVGRSVCVYPNNVSQKYPEDQWFIDNDIQGYIGTPLFDSHNDILGIINASYQSPIKNPGLITTVFQIFSGRIASEIERSDKDQALQKLNKELESKVEARTLEMHQAIEELKHTQAKIIEREKLASLGELVAGIAHEVNTPLGVSITAASHIKDTLNLTPDTIYNKDPRTTELIDNLKEGAEILEDNLLRAKELIEDFKKVAVDQSNLIPSDINLRNFTETVIHSLSPETSKKDISFELNIPGHICLYTYPGDIAQIFINLILNSLIHGFKQRNSGTICINLHDEKESIYIEYKDNGIGIPISIREKVFSPFFTTSREHGGTGLGMSIVFNIIKQKLKGDIELTENEDNEGACFLIRLPREIA